MKMGVGNNITYSYKTRINPVALQLIHAAGYRREEVRSHRK
jgi:hypothetical protein